MVNNNLKTKNHWQKALQNTYSYQKQSISIEFLIPIFGRNDARMNEQIAIGRSLKPSRTR
jgi:hypothetical protein